MGRHATSLCGNITVGIRLDGERTKQIIAFAVRQVARRASLCRVIRG